MCCEDSVIYCYWRSDNIGWVGEYEGKHQRCPSPTVAMCPLAKCRISYCSVEHCFCLICKWSPEGDLLMTIAIQSWGPLIVFHFLEPWHPFLFSPLKPINCPSHFHLHQAQLFWPTGKTCLGPEPTYPVNCQLFNSTKSCTTCWNLHSFILGPLWSSP